MVNKQDSNKEKKVGICDQTFKRLNNNLINVLVRKFKSDRYESFQTKVYSLGIVDEVLFKSA